MERETMGDDEGRERAVKDAYVVELSAIDPAEVWLAGGKGAQLAALMGVGGVRVPAGFCVTTEAFRRFVAGAPEVEGLLDALEGLGPDDHDAVRRLSAGLRQEIVASVLPVDVAQAIGDALGRMGAELAVAVRSSATAEDLPTASFAGLYDTFLDVVGEAAVLDAVRRCFASLFTERAVSYWLRQGVRPHDARMAVVVQRMVEADAAGVLFTADPVSGDRTVAVVEAVVGRGDALVSGRVTPDIYRVARAAVVERTLAGAQPVLTDVKVLELAALGRCIAAHMGGPCDIEWCVADGDIHVVQSRAITTLFPVPPAEDDTYRVYISVGHQQMMTEAMKPLGLSMYRLTSPAPMREAGGRLFVDATAILRDPARRAGLVAMLRRAEPLICAALETLLERGVFGPVSAATEDTEDTEDTGSPAAPPLIEADPALVKDLIARSEASLAKLEREIRRLTGSALLDFIRDDLGELRRILFAPQSHQVILAAMQAAWWLNERLEAWIGIVNAADVLTQSVPDNVTSQMGLELLDVADALRPHPEVVAFLRQAHEDGRTDGVLEAMRALPGGAEAYAALSGWLERYGVRGPGEVDITRPRWRERPQMLVPLLIGHVDHFEPGAGRRRFEQGLDEALRTREEVLARVRALPGGDERAGDVEAMIERVRTFAGYREYPKFAMVSRYFVYRQALLTEGERLVAAGVLGARDDIDFLSLEELQEVARTGRADAALIRARREAYRRFAALVPPRVLTSDGERLDGAYRRPDLPTGALAGLAASAGIVEERARVVERVDEADVQPGDILVTACTDPGWTPLFVTIGGLVTEVGGHMTHGAVIAREYGLPAVVAVPNATRLIRDGQRIRVDGTRGFVEILG